MWPDPGLRTPTNLDFLFVFVFFRLVYCLVPFVLRVSHVHLPRVPRAWCLPCLVSSLPFLLASAPCRLPWVGRAAYNARLQSIGQSVSSRHPLHRLRSSSLSSWFLFSPFPLYISLALTQALIFSLFPSFLCHSLQTFDPFLVFPSPSHFSSSVLFPHLFCILFAPHSCSFLTVPLPSPCSLLPPPSPHGLSPSFCMSECSHFCMDTHLMLLTLASPAGSRVWGN